MHLARTFNEKTGSCNSLNRNEINNAWLLCDVGSHARTEKHAIKNDFKLSPSKNTVSFGVGDFSLVFVSVLVNS